MRNQSFGLQILKNLILKDCVYWSTFFHVNKPSQTGKLPVVKGLLSNTLLVFYSIILKQQEWLGLCRAVGIRVIQQIL
jgi:hypothetical protein